MPYSYVGAVTQQRHKGDTGTTLTLDLTSLTLQAGDIVFTGTNMLAGPVAAPVDLSWDNLFNPVTEVPGLYVGELLGNETSIVFTVGGAVDMAVGLAVVYRNSHFMDNGYADLTGTIGFVTGATPLVGVETTGTTALDITKKYHNVHMGYFDTPNNLTSIVPSSANYTVRTYVQATDPAAPSGGFSRRRVLVFGDSLVEGFSAPPYSSTSWAFSGSNTAPGTYIIQKSESPTQPSSEEEDVADPSLGGLDLRLRRAKVSALPYQLHTRMLGE